MSEAILIISRIWAAIHPLCLWYNSTPIEERVLGATQFHILDRLRRDLTLYSNLLLLSSTPPESAAAYAVRLWLVLFISLLPANHHFRASWVAWIPDLDAEFIRPVSFSFGLF